MYYGLTNFYQNHRSYVKSRDDNQVSKFRFDLQRLKYLKSKSIINRLIHETVDIFVSSSWAIFFNLLTLLVLPLTNLKILATFRAERLPTVCFLVVYYRSFHYDQCQKHSLVEFSKHICRFHNFIVHQKWYDETTSWTQQDWHCFRRW